jgi:hypothetical protein
VDRVGAVGDVEEMGLGVDHHGVHQRGPALDRRDVDAGQRLMGDELQRRLLEAAARQ